MSAHPRGLDLNPSVPRETRAAAALNAVADELRAVMDRFPPFASPHEGYAIILEELDELWFEVKHGTRGRAREEAVQVAAMAVRFLVDVVVFEDVEVTP